MKIAYIMSRFPLLSETFILREMIEVEKNGHNIELFPLMCETHPVTHEKAKEWVARANCIHFISGSILLENFFVFLRNPFRYVYLILQIIWGNRSSLDFLIKGLYLFPKAVFTAKQMQIKNVEHIHVHYASHPALAAWIINKISGITYSVTIHSHDIYDCHAMLDIKLKDALFLVPISYYNIKYLEELLGEWVREKCYVVRCGVDLEKYESSQKTVNAKNEVFKILQIGSLHWKKAQVYLVQVMASLRKRGVPFHLTLIGEGQERTSIEAEIKKHQLENHITLVGAKTQDEVATMLPQTDCYVQSSVSEGIPVAIMEAMACELPVISTNITGIPELVLDGETGILVPANDIANMANALETLYNNPELRRSMGKRGKQWVEQEFTLKKNGKKLVVLFEKLANKKNL
jgi:glycosyltransferase involved in cell wall biosynthesis